MFPARRERQPT